MKKYYALFPLIIAIYPALFLYANNSSEINFTSILPYVGCSIAGMFLLEAFFLLLSRNLMKAALLTLPIFIYFFTIGHLDLFFMDALWKYEGFLGKISNLFSGHFNSRKFHCTWLTLIYLSFFIYWTIKIVRMKSDKVQKLTKSFFAITIVLNLLCLLQLASALLFQKEESIKKAPIIASKTAVDAPDIYYIIPDGYPRADILKKYYKFDNSSFINFLRGKGFFVPTKNFSNYATTFQSLTSSLNMRYINYFAERNGVKSRYIRNVYQELANNEVLHYLKSKGYTTYHYQNSWQGVRKNQYADIQIPCLSLKEMEAPFKNLFWNSTALIMYPPEESVFQRHKCHMNNMKSLNSMPSKPGPKFVFAHFRAPHPPYLFNKKGEWIKNDLYTDAAGPRIKAWFHFNFFLDQLSFMNTQFEELVTNIIKNSKRPPIIIIQSDHGARINNNRKTFEFRYARHSNFIAIYHPQKKSLFKDDLTPVNIFPIIFNNYLDANFPIRPNEYYYTEYNRPFIFTKLDLK